MMRGSGDPTSRWEQFRKDWHSVNYTEQLASSFNIKVIALDIRGEIGERGQSTELAVYALGNATTGVSTVTSTRSPIVLPV